MIAYGLFYKDKDGYEIPLNMSYQNLFDKSAPLMIYEHETRAQFAKAKLIARLSDELEPRIVYKAERFLWMFRRVKRVVEQPRAIPEFNETLFKRILKTIYIRKVNV